VEEIRSTVPLQLTDPSPEGLRWYALKVFYNRVVHVKALFEHEGVQT